MYCKILKNAHTIISGSTGSGKSVLINNLLFRLIRDCEVYKYEIWIADPKRVDFLRFRPFCKEYATEPAQIDTMLEKAVDRMEARYKQMTKENIVSWDGSHIFILLDEFGQILRSKKAVSSLDQLLRLGRAARIHVIAANQNAARTNGCPSFLRVNFTCQVGLHCVDKIASRQAIGFTGCENLPLYGEAYCMTPEDIKPVLYKVEKMDDAKMDQLLQFFYRFPVN